MKTADTQLEIRIKRSRETPGLVVFGKAGHSVYYKRDAGNGSCHESGYDDPENFFSPSKWWAHDYMEQRDSTQYEGVRWINMREAVETEAGYRQVFRGPMVDVDLEPGQVDACPEPSPIMASAMIGDPGNDFGKLLVLQKAHTMTKRTPGPLDSVDTEEYCRLWKAVGAKVGTIRNGQFVEE